MCGVVKCLVMLLMFRWVRLVMPSSGVSVVHPFGLGKVWVTAPPRHMSTAFGWASSLLSSVGPSTADVRVLLVLRRGAYKVRPRAQAEAMYCSFVQRDKERLRDDTTRRRACTTVHTVSAQWRSCGRHCGKPDWGTSGRTIRSNRMMRHRVPSNLASPATSPRRQPPQGYGR